MKKLTLLTILLISFCGFSQEEETQQEETQTEIKKPKKVRKIRPDHEFSFYATQHLNFGDNFLSKGHKPNVGFGTHKNIINVYGFALGFTYEYSRYRVTDPSLAGNIKRTNYHNFSGRLAYDYKLSDQMTLVPYIKIGGAILKQKGYVGDYDRGFGGFEGDSYTFGVNFNYNLDKTVHLFMGLNYNYVSYSVNSNPEYQSFFDRSNQIQIHLGIGFF